MTVNPQHHDWLGLKVIVTYGRGYEMSGRMIRWDGTAGLVTIETPWNCVATAKASRMVLA